MVTEIAVIMDIMHGFSLFRLSQLAKSNKSWKDAILVGLVEDTLEGTRHYPRCQSGAIGWGWLKMSRSSARHVTNVREQTGV